MRRDICRLQEALFLYRLNTLLCVLTGKCSPATPPPWFRIAGPRLRQCHLCQRLHQMRWAAGRVSLRQTLNPPEHKTGLAPVSTCIEGSQGKAFTRPWMLKNDGVQLKQFFSCFFVFSSIRPQQQTVHVPTTSCHCCATAGDGFFSAPDHQSSGSYRSILLKIFHCETNRVIAK